RPLSAHLKSIQQYAGVTLLADGRLAMILDVWGLAAASNLSFTGGGAIGRGEEAELATVVADQLLVVRLREGRRLVIPMDRVTRLEELSSAALEQVGSREAL